MATAFSVRARGEGDDDAIWEILEPIVRAGDVYALPRDLSRKETLAYWIGNDHDIFVAENETGIVGTYFLRANARGGGAHVANAGYATALRAAGRGVASAMCEHSLAFARARGFRAMQFNFVVSTNVRAVTLWERHGFEIAGTLPGAFDHPIRGAVNVYVMFRTL